MTESTEDGTEPWDSSSDERFTNYYAEESCSEESWTRNRQLRDSVLRLLARHGRSEEILDVLDVGCNAGTMCMVWSELGHRVSGLDINAPLLEVARQRATETGYEVDYRLGSATELPWPDASKDVCIGIELLEHVLDWQTCLKEFTRVLKPGGVICVTTTNVLCPRQNEFNLPLYSWYPTPLKRHFVSLAMSTRPDLANYARYPAFHWFSFYSLRRFLSRCGVRSTDHLELTDEATKGAPARLVLAAIRRIPLFKLLALASYPGTIVFGVKECGQTASSRALTSDRS